MYTWTWAYLLSNFGRCFGSYPQLATAELDEKRQWGIQKQVVPLQPEFASLGKYESFTDFIEDADQMEIVVFGGNCLKIGTNVCAQVLEHVLCGMYTKIEMRVSFVKAASFTDAKETTLTEK